MKKNPIIFLESQTLYCNDDKEKFATAGLDIPYFAISPWAVERLAEICRQTGAHVVMYDGEQDHLKMPDGKNLLDAMKEKGIQVDAIINQKLPDRNQETSILIKEEERIRSERSDFINSFIKDNDVDVCALLYDSDSEYAPIKVDKNIALVNMTYFQFGFTDYEAKKCIFSIQQKEVEKEVVYSGIFTPGVNTITQDILKLPKDFNTIKNNHITLQFRDTALTDMIPVKLKDGVTAKVTIDGYGYDKNIGTALHISELTVTDKGGNVQKIHPINDHELHIAIATAPGVNVKDTVKLFQNGRDYHKFSEPLIINGAEYGVFTKKQQVVTKNSIDNNIESKYPQKDQISINSTDAERANILKNEYITICQSKRSLLPPVYDETKRQSVMDVTKSVVSSLHIDNSTYRLEGFPKDVVLTKESIKKSFNIMNQRHTDTKLFPEALTVLDEICKNAVLIQIEDDAKANKESHKGIQDVHHWMSAFHNGEKVYPVKLTVENDKLRDPEKIYFLLTLGEANNITAPIYKKEAANTDLHPGTGEGPSVGQASFKCSVSQFVENFNEKHGILLKHFPDSMLSERQQGIKQTVLAHDSQKATVIAENRSVISKTLVQFREIHDKAIDVLNNLKIDLSTANKHLDFKTSSAVKDQAAKMKEDRNQNKNFDDRM